MLQLGLANCSLIDLPQPTLTKGIIVSTEIRIRRDAISFGSYLLFLSFFVFPFLGLIWGIIHFWGHGVDWFYLIVFIVMYTPTALGTTAGYHRYFTHESFQAKRWVKILLGLFGSAAIQGLIRTWGPLHDLHHKESDGARDPHSPVMPGDDLWTLCKGFWHAQIGWMFLKQDLPTNTPCAIRLNNDPIVRFIDRWILLWITLGGILPALAGYLYEGSWLGAWYGFLWGGLIRVFFHQHFTSAVNSVCHIWGERKFRTGDRSADNRFIALFTFGEGFHNGHHAAKKSALHALENPKMDLTYQFLKLLERFGFVWDVDKFVPSKERLDSLRVVDNCKE